MEAKNADLSALRIDRAADPAAPTPGARRWLVIGLPVAGVVVLAAVLLATSGALGSAVPRSEEHTSELQSQSNLVCRLLLEKKKTSNCSRLALPPRRQS